MRKSNNDSGLTTQWSHRLLAAGLTAMVMAVIMTACSTLQSLPVDDAYYWPEKTEVASQPSQPGQPSQPRTSSQPNTIEYLNVQDTTVTIRIRK